MRPIRSTQLKLPCVYATGSMAPPITLSVPATSCIPNPFATTLRIRARGEQSRAADARRLRYELVRLYPAFTPGKCWMDARDPGQHCFGPPSDCAALVQLHDLSAVTCVLQPTNVG